MHVCVVLGRGEREGEERELWMTNIHECIQCTYMQWDNKYIFIN